MIPCSVSKFVKTWDSYSTTTGLRGPSIVEKGNLVQFQGLCIWHDCSHRKNKVNEMYFQSLRRFKLVDQTKFYQMSPLPLDVKGTIESHI